MEAVYWASFSPPLIKSQCPLHVLNRQGPCLVSVQRDGRSGRKRRIHSAAKKAAEMFGHFADKVVRLKFGCPFAYNQWFFGKTPSLVGQLFQ